jgi:ABC-type glycerol-3-phosphate transport system substrate-binding protein
MLGLSVPQTMDDVRAMIPTLHRNAMSFSIPLSTNMEGYKGFQQTMPFVYQNGGDIYSADGMSATLTDQRTVKGLREMCDLYRVYGLPINVRNFFNSFRSGVIPLGISDFATYLLLQTTAPELADLWDIALAPGVKSEDGTILRYQTAADTATMILSNTNMPDEAYAFLKWWLSSETQVRFATELQRKYGPEYKWNTANLVAFEQMGYPEKHKQVILSMWRDWQKETPRHIAGYMMEREISNLWGSVVRDGEPFMPTLDQAEMAVNREMLRKLYEFGFVDANGNTIRPYNNRTVEDLKAALQREEAAQ